MTITLFISIFTAGVVGVEFLTEAIKKAYANANKAYSPNMIALINSVVIGFGGTAVTYILMDIPWTVNNVVCALLMVFVMWLGSMLGYDKVLQLLNQYKDSQEKKEEK